MEFDAKKEALKVRRRRRLARFFGAGLLVVMTALTVTYFFLPTARVSKDSLSLVGNLTGLRSQAYDKEDVLEAMGAQEGSYLAFQSQAELAQNLTDAWFVNPSYGLTLEVDPFNMTLSYQDVFPLARIEEDGSQVVYLSDGEALSGESERALKAREAYPSYVDVASLVSQSLPLFVPKSSNLLSSGLVGLALLDPEALASTFLLAVRDDGSQYFLYYNLPESDGDYLPLRIRLLHEDLENLKQASMVAVVGEKVGQASQGSSGHVPVTDSALPSSVSVSSYYQVVFKRNDTPSGRYVVNWDDGQGN